MGRGLDGKVKFPLLEKKLNYSDLSRCCMQIMALHEKEKCMKFRRRDVFIPAQGSCPHQFALGFSPCQV